MLITKRGEKPHDYRKFRCSTCSSEFIYDTKDTEQKYNLYVACPVCGDILNYNEHGQGCISTEEYNKIKSQYVQKG